MARESKNANIPGISGHLTILDVASIQDGVQLAEPLAVALGRDE
jgi:hypothetical protein